MCLFQAKSVSSDGTERAGGDNSDKPVKLTPAGKSDTSKATKNSKQPAKLANKLEQKNKAKPKADKSESTPKPTVKPTDKSTTEQPKAKTAEPVIKEKKSKSRAKLLQSISAESEGSVKSRSSLARQSSDAIPLTVSQLESPTVKSAPDSDKVCAITSETVISCEVEDTETKPGTIEIDAFEPTPKPTSNPLSKPAAETASREVKSRRRKSSTTTATSARSKRRTQSAETVVSTSTRAPRV